MDMSVHGDSNPKPLGGSSNERLLKNEQFDEALDVSQSMDVNNTPLKQMQGGGGGLEAKGTDGSGKSKFSDKPYDEAASMSDSTSDSSVDTNASPKNIPHREKEMSPGELRKHQDHALTAHPTTQKTTVGHLSPTTAPAGGMSALNASRDSVEESREDSDSDESSDDSGDEEGGEGATLNVEGAYNPAGEYARSGTSEASIEGGATRKLAKQTTRFEPIFQPFVCALKLIPSY